MSKVGIIFEVASCASLIIVGSTTVSQMIQEPEEIVIVEEQEQPTKEIIPVDPGPVVIEPEQVVKPETVDPTPESMKSTTPESSKPVTPTQQTPTPTQPSTPKYKYTNALEFQRAYKGWCPKDVPADAYHKALPKSLALGYLDIDYASYKSIDEAAIYVWSWYQGARVNAKNDSSVFLDLYYRKMNSSILGDDGITYNNFILKADAYTKTVTWNKTDGLPQNVIEQMDTVALQIKNKMIQLDQQYIAKCGY